MLLTPEFKKIEAEKLSMTSGTWTPYVTTVEGVNPDATYTKQRGFYVKIGKLVYVEFYINGKITKLNGTNNYAVIKGLPKMYHSENNMGQEGLNLNVLYSLTNNPTDVTLLLARNGIAIQNNFGASAAKLIVTPTNYFEVSGSGFYMIDEE